MAGAAHDDDVVDVEGGVGRGELDVEAGAGEDGPGLETGVAEASLGGAEDDADDVLLGRKVDLVRRDLAVLAEIDADVAVVDDDAAQGSVIQALLQPLGFVVHLAGNGADGIALAERHPPDLVLLDIQMPGMDGWETAARLRASGREPLRIVMVSANVHEFRAGGDGDSSHDAFITKPVDLDQLLIVICNQLDLTWRHAAPASSPAVDTRISPLPAEASRFVEALHALVKVGHVRGIESTLDEFEVSVPAAAPLVSTLRRHSGDFNLKALRKALDDVDAR